MKELTDQVTRRRGINGTMGSFENKKWQFLFKWQRKKDRENMKIHHEIELPRICIGYNE